MRTLFTALALCLATSAMADSADSKHAIQQAKLDYREAHRTHYLDRDWSYELNTVDGEQREMVKQEQEDSLRELKRLKVAIREAKVAHRETKRNGS